MVEPARPPSISRRLYGVGCRIAEIGANGAGHPATIVLVAAFCAVWFLATGPAGENTLTLILSVAAITLTQMVLNQQRRSERALHLKIDELLIAMKGARNEIAGIETKSDEELEALRRTGDVVEEMLERRRA